MSWKAFFAGVASILDIWPAAPRRSLRDQIESDVERFQRDADNLRKDFAPYGRHDDGRPVTEEEAAAEIQRLKDAGLLQVTEFSPRQQAELKEIFARARERRRRRKWY